MPPTPGILNPSHSHETPVSLRQVFWSDEVARKIEADFQALPEAPKHDQARRVGTGWSFSYAKSDGAPSRPEAPSSFSLLLVRPGAP